MKGNSGRGPLLLSALLVAATLGGTAFSAPTSARELTAFGADPGMFVLQSLPPTTILNNDPAVGIVGEIRVSSDNGQSWKRVASGTTNCLWGVANAAGHWVAVGLNNTILCSTDGAHGSSTGHSCNDDYRDVG